MDSSLIELLVFLPLILALGIQTSYTDFKEGKIRNKDLLVFGILGVILYVILIGYFYFSAGVNMHYIIVLLTNIAFALVVGFGLWKQKVWSAGDAKLFFIFSLLIPNSSYKIGYIEYFPALVLLVNIFVPAALIYSIKLFFDTDKKKIKLAIKNNFSLNKIARSIGIFFSFFWILSLIGIDNVFIKFVLMFGLDYLIGRLGPYQKFLIIPLAILRMILDSSVYSFAFASRFIFYIIVYIVIRSFILELSSQTYKTKSKKDRTFFAAYMFLGVIITLALKGNIVLIITNFIRGLI